MAGRRIPLRSKASKLPASTRKVPKPLPLSNSPVFGKQVAGELLDPSLGRSIVSSGEECLGGESQPAGWAENCGPAASGGLGTPEHQQDPSWDFHTPA